MSASGERRRNTPRAPRAPLVCAVILPPSAGVLQAWSRTFADGPDGGRPTRRRCRSNVDPWARRRRPKGKAAIGGAAGFHPAARACSRHAGSSWAPHPMSSRPWLEAWSGRTGGWGRVSDAPAGGGRSPGAEMSSPHVRRVDAPSARMRERFVAAGLRSGSCGTLHQSMTSQARQRFSWGIEDSAPATPPPQLPRRVSLRAVIREPPMSRPRQDRPIRVLSGRRGPCRPGRPFRPP
jgi:hypothetical protein